MIAPPTVLRIERSYTRSHPYIADMLTFYALMLRAMGGDLSDGQRVILACAAANMDLHISLDGYLAAATSGEPPELVDIFTAPKLEEPSGPYARGTRALASRLTCAMFSVFAEKAGDWLKRNHSTDYHAWPPTNNFGRVTRNAIVHGGTINISSSAAPTVSWRGITYSHNDHGREIVSADLSLGDLVILMLEMEIELNALGAPFDLG